MNIVKSRAAFAIALVLGLAATMETTGAAKDPAGKDSMTVTVTNATGSPVIWENGQAVGTIQLFYTVTAMQFTPGEFASFDLNWIVNAGSPPADYGTGQTFKLLQSQQGGNVRFSAAPASFLLTAAGQSGLSRLTVSIEPDKDGSMPSSADGTDLVGNLKLDAGSKVGTVTNIQVHIRLVHPSTSCLKMYNFVTDQDFNLGILTTTSLNVPANGRNAGVVVSSQPGQFSDNVLIANTCVADQSFDLEIGLDSAFSTNPSGNPGNAVFTYTSAGEFNSSNFDVLMAGTGTPNHQNLCLQNVTVPAGASFLATVHSKTKDGLPKGDLPTDGTFDFAATLHDGVNLACKGAPYALVSPNPAPFALPFTIK